MRPSLLILAFSVLALPAQAAAPFHLVTVAEDFDFPWALAFLPEGDYLVTEKPGRLLRVTAEGQKTEIKGLPPIVARGQGGLLDIIVDPAFAQNRTVYFSYVARGQGGTGTQVARARLEGNALENVRVIFAAEPKRRTDLHFGSRLLFGPDGKLYITLGERFYMEEAQDPGNNLGSIIRLNPDGSVPDDNPFIGRNGFRPENFTYGNRNVQGIALEPGTDMIWFHEHGPQGGDEVNILKAGANYGWPEITYGINYDGRIISPETKAPGMEPPVIHWTPSIAPSGMAFYQGDKFPEWQGDIFVGALAGTHLRRLDVEEGEIVDQEVLLEDLGERIRDVRSLPDGFLYILTDSHDGRLIRLVPRTPGQK